MLGRYSARSASMGSAAAARQSGPQEHMIRHGKPAVRPAAFSTPNASSTALTSNLSPHQEQGVPYIPDFL
jgi:hypothetical protein